MSNLYYLCFSVNRLPDLTLTKYSVFDGSSVDNIIEKHSVFLRQLYRHGYSSRVYFHLLYYYQSGQNIPKGQHLKIFFYATSAKKERLVKIREFLTKSVLSTYYDFLCYDISDDFTITNELLSDGSTIPVVKMHNISGQVKTYALGNIPVEEIEKIQNKIRAGEQTHAVCEIASDADVILSVNRMPVDQYGRIVSSKRFHFGAFLTKKDYFLPAQNRLDTYETGNIPLYSIMEWEPSESGRLFNVLKLMEGYDQDAVVRIDIFPVEHTQAIRQKLPYAETRKRIAARDQGKDDNSENIIKSWDKYLNNLMKFPQFYANVVAFSDTKDVAVMLADSVAAEAVESGTYIIEEMSSAEGFDMYQSDAEILHGAKEEGNYVAPFLSLYTLEEVRPMFSFPILYPGESIECQKETDPVPFKKEVTIDDKGVVHEVMSLGISSLGYDVTFPVRLLVKHAFIAGVPGAGKTNTMLYFVTTLWRDTKQHIPFLVLEPAKQEYRALAMIPGMEKLCVFSPGADTRFPLHINPFQFPEGLTLAEHIANLNSVFAGAFELIPPSPFLIDQCIERVYLNKGWNINERNNGSKPYPTMQELYDSLKIAVEESGYEGESKANIRSVMEVRIGSLLRREIGNVYNVNDSSLKPEEWLSVPAIIELEALGEGPANFMSLLISTLIREVLKIRKTSDNKEDNHHREIEHVIFYEEAHNLIGPTAENPPGGSVDPKISATKYIVKMLAEVRALNEGIVIADQLPTAMAPEVLKNTGLKIAHRITAQDDRNLLGSTMSASPDQLEEQGTFGTGQALIFYEDLLKPYKMRVAEWEKGLKFDNRSKYDSPSNMQLFEVLKNNESYDFLLRKSATIMQDKMRAEFNTYREQAKILKKTINDKYLEIRRVQYDIDMYSARLEKETETEIRAQLKQHIANLQLSHDKKMESINGAVTRRLTTLCWNYANLYYANMTLSSNYYSYCDDMYMCTINNYLSLFITIKSLYESPELMSVLLKETEGVMKDIQKYISIFEQSGESLLEKHPGYYSAFVDCGYYIVNKMDTEALELARAGMSLSVSNAEKDLAHICEKMNESYFKYLAIAEKYKDYSDRLISQLENDMTHEYERGSDKWVEARQLHEKYTVGELLIYKTIPAFVNKIMDSFSRLNGLYREQLLIATKKVRESYLEIVNYRNPEAHTIISEWNNYHIVLKQAYGILSTEMANIFYIAKQKRDTVLLSQPNTESSGQIKDVLLLYSTLFKRYASIPIDSYEYRYPLICYYANTLEAVLKLGKYTHSVIAETTNGAWSLCLRFINSLKDDDRIKQSTKDDWMKLAIMMKPICDP